MMFTRWIIAGVLTFCILVTSVIGQDTQTLDYGIPASGEISDSQRTLIYTFSGTPGELIYITAYAQNHELDIEMRLFDPNNNFVAETDYRNALWFIGPITLGAEGTYTLRIVRPDGNTANGSISVMVDQAVIVPLEIDTPVEGLLPNPNTLLFFAFNVETEALLKYTMIGTMASFSVRSQFGDFLLEEGLYDDPMLPLMRVSADETFTLYLRTAAETGTPYHMLVEHVSPIPAIPGEPLTGTVESGIPVIFAFDSLPGKAWQIRATIPQEGDRYMFVYQLTDREWWDIRVALDYGSGPGGNPRIAPFVAPAEATYYVELFFESYTSTLTGDYEFLITPDTVLSLASGIEINGTITPDTGTAVYLYTGTAGSVIRVTLSRTSDTGILTFNIYSEEGEIVTFVGQGASAATFDITLPTSGTYQFLVANADYESQEMTFSLRLETPGSK